MIRSTSAALCVVLFLNLSFPAFADSTDLHSYALNTMDSQTKAKLVRATDRFAEKLFMESATKQARFFRVVDRLAAVAYNKVQKLSDKRLAARLDRLERQALNLEPSEALQDATRQEIELAHEASAYADAAFARAPSEVQSLDELEAASSRVNQVLDEALSGNSRKEALLNSLHTLRMKIKGELAQKQLVDRKIAALWIYDAIFLFILLLPLMLGVVIGLSSGAILIPVIIGAALSVALFRLARAFENAYP